VDSMIRLRVNIDTVHLFDRESDQTLL